MLGKDNQLTAVLILLLLYYLTGREQIRQEPKNIKLILYLYLSCRHLSFGFSTAVTLFCHFDHCLPFSFVISNIKEKRSILQMAEMLKGAAGFVACFKTHKGICMKIHRCSHCRRPRFFSSTLAQLLLHSCSLTV